MVNEHDHSIYDEAYFLRGQETGKSLYVNYRWLPDLTIPMACAMIHHLKIETKDTILDFGCARGYTVRAFREMGYKAFGIDASQWAVSNSDESVGDFIEYGDLPYKAYDWIIAKDVLEHLDSEALILTLQFFAQLSNKGVFIVVPLSPSEGAPYTVPEYEADVTHKQRLPLERW